MDLRMYYQKIRELEQSFKGTFPVVVSQETQDGGTAGVKTEVPVHIAARPASEGQEPCDARTPGNTCSSRIVIICISNNNPAVHRIEARIKRERRDCSILK